MTFLRVAVALVALVVLVRGLPKFRFQKNGDCCGCHVQGLGCASARPSSSNFSVTEIRSLLLNETLRWVPTVAADGQQQWIDESEPFLVPDGSIATQFLSLSMYDGVGVRNVRR
jgi:hypothetical protein